MFCKTVFVFIFFLSSIYAAVIERIAFKECQKEYDAKIGELVASTGISAASTVWRVLFNGFDLNGNNLVSASELILKLNAEDITFPHDVKSTLVEAQSWISVGKPSGLELTSDEFIDVVGKTIGQNAKSIRSTNDWSPVADAMCNYLNDNIPQVTSLMQDLTNCTTTLKQDQVHTIEMESGRMAVNLWKAVFSTIDTGRDLMITNNEIAETILRFNPEMKASKKAISDALENYLKSDSIDDPLFLKKIKSLFFDSEDDRPWNDVTSLEQLEGKTLFCLALRQTSDDVNESLDVNYKCVNTYEDTLIKVLGKDTSIAPYYIFTVADKNKDGRIFSDVLATLILASQHRSVTFDTHFNSTYDLETFTKFLPSHVVDVKEYPTDDTFELSTLSSYDQKIWHAWCLTTIDILESFPSSTNFQPKEQENLDTDVISPEDEDLINELSSILSSGNDTEAENILPMLEKLIESFPLSTINPEKEEELLDGTDENTLSTNEEVTTTSPDLTTALAESSTISEDNLAEVVRDVVNDLTNDNGTDSAETTDQSLETLLEILNTTNAAESEEFGFERSYTKEEQELYDLLLEYRDNLEGAKTEYGNKPTANTYKTSGIKNKMTKEEDQLLRLLSKAIEEETESYGTKLFA